MLKALEINPLTAKSFFQSHRFMMYFPHPRVLDAYLEKTKDDYPVCKEFLKSIFNRPYILKSETFFNDAILIAGGQKDYEQCTRLYSDILNYKKVNLSTEAMAYVMIGVQMWDTPLIHKIKFSMGQVEPDHMINLLRTCFQKKRKYLKLALEAIPVEGIHPVEKLRDLIFTKEMQKMKEMRELFSDLKARVPELCPEEPGYYTLYDLNAKEETSEEKKEETKTEETGAQEEEENQAEETEAQGEEEKKE